MTNEQWFYTHTEFTWLNLDDAGGTVLPLVAETICPVLLYVFFFLFDAVFTKAKNESKQWPRHFYLAQSPQCFFPQRCRKSQDNTLSTVF